MAKSGAGSGTLTSTPAGISCRTDYSEPYRSGTVVSLSATPAIGSVLVGWSGACTGTGPCTVTITANQSATAMFDPSIAVTLTATPGTVTAGGTVRVSWTAPGGSSMADWIGLYQIGAPNTSYLTYRYTNGAASGSAPETPGTYEFHYLLNNGHTDVARSNPVTVTAPMPSVSRSP